MKKMFNQLYEEGFASIFYKKPTSFIEKRIKNKKIAKIINLLIKITYTILLLSFAIYVLYKKLPI